VVTESQDAFVLKYVLENLGKGVPTTTKWALNLRKQREVCYYLFVTQGQTSPISPSDQLKQQLKLQRQRQAMQIAEYQALMRKQFEQALLDQAKLKEMLDVMLREMLKEDAATVAQKLNDPEPWVRWVAIHAASKKWMRLEQELIELLNDPYPAIRETARQALIRLSRGNDFGPLPKAKQAQITQAQEQWQSWLGLQTAVRSPPSYEHGNLSK
jgi:hypothetical protein